MDLADKLNSLRNQPPTYWATAANQHLPGWLTALFVVVIAWYLVKIVWLLIPTDNIVDLGSSSTPVIGTESSAQKTTIDFPKIAAAHLFGEAGAEPPPIQAVDAPETRLNLKLRGAVAAEDKETAHAIISDGGGKDKVYFIGDKLPGGAKLHEVYQDRVILSRNGILETLRLPKISQGRRSPSRPPTRPGQPPVASTGAIPNMAQGGAPASFTDVIRPQPFMPNGRLAGYRVYPGRDRRKFAALGLRPGDLVTEINGQSLTDMQSGMETFREMANATQVVITVERGGTAMVLTLDSDQISSISSGSGATQ